MSALPAARTVAVISTVHDTHDTRIFYKQIGSLRKHFRVLYFSPIAGLAEEEWIVPLHRSRSKLGRVRTHLSLWRRLPGTRADLYLLHDPELLPLGIFLALLGRKVVWDMHEDTYNDIGTKTYLPRYVRWMAAGIYRLFQSLAYRTLSGFILAEDAYGKYFPDSSKICVVHNYPMLDRLREFAPLPKHPATLVYIGSISVNRGIYQLLEIMDKLRSRLEQVKLVLIGPFTSEALERDVRRLVFDRGLSPHVDIRGPIRNVEAYPLMAQCAAGLALLLPEPNFVKSLPTKMFEYMALGLPVVVSNFPLWAGIVERHQAGIAVDPCDTAAVATAIEGLLAENVRYREFSDNALAAAEQYSWETESVTLSSFLSRMMAA